MSDGGWKAVEARNIGEFRFWLNVAKNEGTDVDWKRNEDGSYTIIWRRP